MFARLLSEDEFGWLAGADRKLGDLLAHPTIGPALLRWGDSPVRPSRPGRMFRLLERIARRLPWKHVGIDEGSGPHFVRYTVLDTPFGSVYLHRFIRSDRDRCLHDHPWPFAAAVLAGRYVEQLPAGNGDDEVFASFKFVGRPAGSVRFYRASHAHRISSVAAGTWSLVVVGRKSRAWGFWTPRGWVAWEPDRDAICE